MLCMLLGSVSQLHSYRLQRGELRGTHRLPNGSFELIVFCLANQNFKREIWCDRSEVKERGQGRRSYTCLISHSAAIGNWPLKRSRPSSAHDCHLILLNAISVVCSYLGFYTWYSECYILFFILFLSMVHSAECNPSSVKVIHKAFIPGRLTLTGFKAGLLSLPAVFACCLR